MLDWKVASTASAPVVSARLGLGETGLLAQTDRQQAQEDPGQEIRKWGAEDGGSRGRAPCRGRRGEWRFPGMEVQAQRNPWMCAPP